MGDHAGRLDAELFAFLPTLPLPPSKGHYKDQKAAFDSNVIRQPPNRLKSSRKAARPPWLRRPKHALPTVLADGDVKEQLNLVWADTAVGSSFGGLARGSCVFGARLCG